MNTLDLTAKREQFCAAYSRALTDAAFRTQLRNQPGAAMSPFGFSVRQPTTAILIGLLLPAVQKIRDGGGGGGGTEPPPV